MRTGRVETFIYSSKERQHLGGSIVKVLCTKESTINHRDFVDFCRRVAQIAYVYQANNWNVLMYFNDEVRVDEERMLVEKSLNERIIVDSIQVYTLADPKKEHLKHHQDWTRKGDTI